MGSFVTVSCDDYYFVTMDPSDLNVIQGGKSFAHHNHKAGCILIRVPATGVMRGQEFYQKGFSEVLKAYLTMFRVRCE